MGHISVHVCIDCPIESRILSTAELFENHHATYRDHVIVVAMVGD